MASNTNAYLNLRLTIFDIFVCLASCYDGAIWRFIF